MTEILLKLLGIRSADSGEIQRWSIHFANLKTPFQVLLFLIASSAIGWCIWWFYKREPDYCSLRRRRVLALLRLAGVLVLMFIVSGPVLDVDLREYVKGKVVILVDTSQSMSRIDKYKRPEDKLVAAHVLGCLPPGENDPRKIDSAAEAKIAAASRMDLLRAVFEDKNAPLLGELQKKYDVEMWGFSRASEMQQLGAGLQKLDTSELTNLTPDGVVTEIGGALRATVNRLKGQPLSAIICLTDGGNNRGEEPAVVAQDISVRVFPVGIGVPESNDLAIAHISLESKIFIDDAAPIYVRIQQHGFSGGQAELIVTSDNEELARQTVSIRESREQTEVVRVTPKKPGRFVYKVEIKPSNPAAEDSEPSNNAKSRDVEVIDQKIEVLVVEAEPRWEFRYLKNSLLRDKRVNCKIVLYVPDLSALAKPGSYYLKEFPSREALFKYHAIVFGNIPNEGCLSSTDIDNLRRFVEEEGGGIWFIAGKNNFPNTYKDTKLDFLLPIEYERLPDVKADDERQQPLTEGLRLALTPEGGTHSVTRLDPASYGSVENRNTEYWGLVPPFYWRYKATRLKLNATALLVSDDKRSLSRQETDPLLVVSQVGRGRVLYQAFADLWRMRYPIELGPDALERFHGQAIQYLGLSKLLGRTARIEITVDKENYGIGDPVKITARVLTKKDLENSTAEHVTAVVTHLENESIQSTVELTPEPGQKGAFRGEHIAGTVGKFRVTMKDEDDENAHVDYSVFLPQVEMDNPDMKKELLDNVAKSSVKGNAPGTGAQMYFADQMVNLLNDLQAIQRPIDKRRENSLWDAPILLILFTLFMGCEWLIRKRSDLL